MRDVLIVFVILSALVVALRFPFAGLLLWAWFTLVTPHQLAYGAFGIPLNSLIAGTTILSILINGAISRFRLDLTIGIMLLFCAWLLLSQHFSLDPTHSAPYTDRFLKTMVFILLCTQMVTSRLRLHALLWVLVLGLGFFAVKGAIFTILTFGQYRVQGIDETLMGDNNHIGIMLATSLPLILYLRGEASRPIVKQGLMVVFLCAVLSIIGTHSRGAFLSIIVFAGYFWLKSNHKIAIASLVVLLSIPLVAMVPSKWTARMSTITEATQDESFMGRVDAWYINTAFARENPLTGAGLRVPYQTELAKTVDPARAPRAKAAHSIYFEILGGMGIAGLFIFLSIIGTGFFSALRLQKLGRKEGQVPPWVGRFGYFSQISLAVFCIGGASASLEMWDGYLLVIALIASASHITSPLGANARQRGSVRKRFSWRLAARGIDTTAGRRLKSPIR
ncbi:MAG: putative O-glycosylation ligase, exosortase A system-associated [Pseudomonadota bacterium]